MSLGSRRLADREVATRYDSGSLILLSFDGELVKGFLSKLVGNRGERAAAKYLRRLGYRILARQYRNQFGEIDLICKDGNWIVFTEVKTRRSTKSGQPFEAVNHAKQKKMTNLALVFLRRHGMLERSARFDVVSIVWPDDEKTPQIEHYKNAFEPHGSGQMFS